MTLRELEMQAIEAFVAWVQAVGRKGAQMADKETNALGALRLIGEENIGRRPDDNGRVEVARVGHHFGRDAARDDKADGGILQAIPPYRFDDDSTLTIGLDPEAA